MSLNTKAIKTKIKSVQNTRKITKAMEMIAAAKMRKAVKAASQSRAYTALLSEISKNVASKGRISHPLARKQNSDKALLIIIASNRGLCGSFNTAVELQVRSYLTENTQLGGDASIDAVAIGKKAARIASRTGLNLVQAYDELPETIQFADILPVINNTVELYREQKYSKVSVIYTQFISSLLQKTKTATILPVSLESVTDFITPSQEAEGVESSSIAGEEYKFEQQVEQIMDYVVHRVIEAQIFQVFLESSASEHSSRMVAMKNASDAAKDILRTLTLDYNVSRQAAITQEISEISNAADAIVD